MMSWGELFRLLSVLLFLYYTVVVLVLYRKDLRGLLRRQERPTQPVAAGDTHSPPVKPAPSLQPVIHELMEELKAVFAAAAEHQLDKAQVLEALTHRLQRYPTIRGTVLQAAIESYITEELQSRSGLVLSGSELVGLWPAI